MRCENGGPIADEFGAMFLLKRFPFEWMQDGSHGLSFVIAGLDRQSIFFAKNTLAKQMDPRVKPADDARESEGVEPIRTGTAFRIIDR